ncbi:MAG: SDR family NAD(P)-dependent oxidoreductase [Pseudomonadota bacterium]
MTAEAMGFSDARGYACDVTDGAAVADVFTAVAEDLGPVDTVVYNAGSGAWGSVDDVSPEDLGRNMEINATGLMRVAQAVLPVFRAEGRGNIVVIGAGAATRGRAKTIAFAAGKAAQRSVAQSLARHLGPEKIHVSYVIIDGGIASEERGRTGPDFLKADAIADAVYALTQQDESAWSFEIDLRPFGESW